MNAIILTEGSKTVEKEADDPELIEYFQGQFRPVTILIEELSKMVNTDTYILSNEYGLCKGRTSISEVDQLEDENDIGEDAQQVLRDTIPDADVVVLLLTKSTFIDVVEPIWDEVVMATKPNTTWCIGLPETAINCVDIDSLRAKVDLYVYRRSGVARLGNETRDQLLSAVRERE